MFIVFPRLRLRISIFALPSMLVLLWCEGGIPFMILMLSCTFHEIGHLLAINMLGYRIRRVDILPMGALIVLPEGIPDKDEYKIAIFGPLASLLLSFISFVMLLIFPATPMLFSALINLTLALFNLMPIKKLDGGKAINCFLNYKYPQKEKRTEKICSLLSSICKLLFLLLVSFFMAVTDFNLGVILLSAVLLVQLLNKS